MKWVASGVIFGSGCLLRIKREKPRAVVTGNLSLKLKSTGKLPKLSISYPSPKLWVYA
jgi:hypothetical protein